MTPAAHVKKFSPSKKFVQIFESENSDINLDEICEEEYLAHDSDVVIHEKVNVPFPTLPAVQEEQPKMTCLFVDRLDLVFKKRMESDMQDACFCAWSAFVCTGCPQYFSVVRMWDFHLYCAQAVWHFVPQGLLCDMFCVVSCTRGFFIS